MARYILKLYLLTFYQVKVVFFLLLQKLNKPTVSEKRALPVVVRKGIISITLVISREPDNPTVKRGICRMFLNFFKVKTKSELQVEEYIKFKAKSSPHIADNHKDILSTFVKEIGYKDIVSEITLEQLEAYHKKTCKEVTYYTSIKVMQAIRAFMRFHKVNTDIKAQQITNTGIIELQNVAKIDKVAPMTKRRNVGRPPNVAFIKEVQRLVDKEGLGIRAIARAKMMNPGNISRAYHYDLTKVA